MLNPLRSPTLLGMQRTLRGVDLERKAKLGSRRAIKFKINLGILRLNMRKVLVLKVVSLLVLLVGRSTMESA